MMVWAYNSNDEGFWIIMSSSEEAAQKNADMSDCIFFFADLA